MAFSVRRATVDDLDMLLTFILAEAQEAEGSQKSEGVVERGIRAGLEDSLIANYWVLESPDLGVVGSTSIIKEWSDWHAAYYWWIQSMYIKPEHRGRNLMKLLVAEVMKRAREEDALEIRLYVHKDNRRAIRAYEKHGFSAMPYQIMQSKL